MKIFLFIIVGLFSSGYVVVDNIIDDIKKVAKATVSSNTLKHKKKVAQLKAKHKKDVAQLKAKHKKDVAKVKAKERSKRWLSSMPGLGIIMAVLSSKDIYKDFEQWQQDYPDLSFEDYFTYQVELHK